MSDISPPKIPTHGECRDCDLIAKVVRFSGKIQSAAVKSVLRDVNDQVDQLLYEQHQRWKLESLTKAMEDMAADAGVPDGVRARCAGALAAASAIKPLTRETLAREEVTP